MKKFETIITGTGRPKITITPDRISIKFNEYFDKNKIGYLKKIAFAINEKIKQLDISMRGKVEIKENGTAIIPMVNNCKKNKMVFEYNGLSVNVVERDKFYDKYLI